MIDLSNFEKMVNSLTYYLDDVYGYRLFKAIKKEERAFIERDEDKMKPYVALQFLIIPHLSTKEIAELLKEKVLIGLQTEDIDLTERITKKLINMDLTDRDNCKKELKLALENNRENLTSNVVTDANNKIKTVSDWIKDYLNQMRGGGKGSLSEAQYFFQKSYFVKLSESEKGLLKKLFALYKFLSTSSFTPEGFEDDLLLEDQQGRLMTTNKGKVVILNSPPKKESKKPEAKFIQVNNNSEDEAQLNELRQLLAQYPSGTLERKAVEEEIKKLEAKN